MMTRSSWTFSVGVFGSVFVSSVLHAADAENGKRIAERWCAACHVVSGTQKNTSTEAPPFSAIAARPAFDAGAVALFLLQPHPKMPDVGLSRDAAADLAAYISRQRE